MKKIRIELKQGALAKSLIIFDSAESLYFWLDNDKSKEPEGSLFVDITRDEFIEIEWMGCEFVYEKDNSVKRLDSVRMAKCMPTKNSGTPKIFTYNGWISSDSISFKDHEDNSSYTTILHDSSQWKLDFSVLFSDEEQTEP